MSENMPFYRSLVGLEKHISFHTPGHKLNSSELLGAAALDYTELSCTGDLYSPSGALMRAEKSAAELFRVRETVFSAGGATLCIQTALSFFARKRVLAERRCHKSVVNAALLTEIDLCFIYGEYSAEVGTVLPITPEALESRLEKESFSAVVITSPDYNGRCANLPSIAAVCEKHNTALIVDSSHGTHLCALYPEVHEIGDYIIHSPHKTLPTLTGGALLHVNGKNAPSYSELKEHMSVFGSTSPSFAILASVDYGVSYLFSHAELFCKTAERVKKTAERLSAYGYGAKPEREALRLCLNPRLVGYTAAEVSEILEKNGIYAEGAFYKNLIFLFSPFNTEEELCFTEKVLLSLEKRAPLPDIPGEYTVPERVLTVREAFLSPKETVLTDKAVNRIVAGAYAACPPGIPLLLYGERAEEGILKKLDCEYITVIKE